MMPQIDYHQKQNVFIIKGIRKETIPFSIHYHYRMDSPGSELRQNDPGQVREIPEGWQITTPEMNLVLTWKEVKSGLEMTLRLMNCTSKRLFIQGICPADIQLQNLLSDPGQHKFYQHGFQSWSPSRPVPADQGQVYPRIRSFALMNQNVDSPFWGRKDGLISHLFTLLDDKLDGQYLFTGFTSQRTGLGEFFLCNKGRAQLTGFLDYGGKLLNPEEELVTEPLLIQYGLPDQLIAEFMERLGKNMNARVGDRSPVGWCSWYEFYTSVSQEHLRVNSQYLADNPDLDISFVQLDDGYQTAVGDWLSINAKFPSGLEPIARDIHKKGFKAGIWLAPFFASRRSNLFKNNPEWFLKDYKGRPVDCGYNPNWKSRAAALDLTHPGVEDWLKNIFGQLKAYGFDYFKIDFLFAGIRHGQRVRTELSPVETFRHGLEVIREVIGDRFLLGCGAPIGPSIGLVDAMRVSEDVKETWNSPLWEWLGRGCGVPSAKACLRNNIQRHYTHRKLWLNDPDCLLIRDHQTRLSLEEVRTQITLLGMTGGMLFLSDDLSKLNPSRLDIIKAILPPTPLTGRPEEQFKMEFPFLFKLIGMDASVVALTNWHRRPQTFELGKIIPKDTHGFDFWNNAFLKESKITLAGHATLAAQLSPFRKTPYLAGSTFHLTAMADGRIQQHFDQDKKELTIMGRNLSRHSGELWIVVPEGYTPRKENLKHPTQQIKTWEQGIRLLIELAASWEVTIKFQ